MGGSHFTLDSITSNILALRNRQGHGSLAALHQACAKDPLLMLQTSPANCPTNRSRPRAVIYLHLRIDRLCFYTLVHTVPLTFTNDPMSSVCVVVKHRLWSFLPRSLSYVTCMGSFSFLLLGAMYFIIDVKGCWSGRPFIYPGTVYSLFKSVNAVLTQRV